MKICLVNFAGGSFCWNYAIDTFYGNYAGDNVCSKNPNIGFNFCARLGFNVIWFVKCMKIRELKIEIISI